MRLEDESSLQVVYKACSIRVSLGNMLFPFSAVEIYVTFRKCIYTSYKVENRSLACSIRTDESEDFTFVY